MGGTYTGNMLSLDLSISDDDEQFHHWLPSTTLPNDKYHHHEEPTKVSNDTALLCRT